MLEKFLRDIRVQHTRLDRLSTLPPVPDEDIEGMVKVLLLSSERGSGSVVVCAFGKLELLLSNYHRVLAM